MGLNLKLLNYVFIRFQPKTSIKFTKFKIVLSMKRINNLIYDTESLIIFGVIIVATMVCATIPLNLSKRLKYPFNFAEVGDMPV
jgi:hypothetical protein